MPLDSGGRARLIFRWRATTQPWWLTLGTWAVILPADFLMSRDMLHGVKRRAEQWGRTRPRSDDGGQPASAAGDKQAPMGSVPAMLIGSFSATEELSVSALREAQHQWLRRSLGAWVGRTFVASQAAPWWHEHWC
jgi:hypothetical protein